MDLREQGHPGVVCTLAAPLLLLAAVMTACAPATPPMIEKPSHELLAEVLLANGRAAQAELEFETALKRMPQRTTDVRGGPRQGSSSGDGFRAGLP
ncbi:MAG TPA: hypothetical protein VGL65_04790 [Gemmatimonadales bacterium]|jgi:hypothetical protein